MNAENHEQKPKRRRRPGDFAVVQMVHIPDGDKPELRMIAAGLTTLGQAKEWLGEHGLNDETYRVIRFLGRSITVTVKQQRKLKVS